MDNLLYEPSKIQYTDSKKTSTPTSRPGPKRKINIYEKNISNLKPNEFKEKLQSFLDGYNYYIPNPYEVASFFEVPYKHLDEYIMQNIEVQNSWNMYTELWITDFFVEAKKEKLTEKHYAIKIANELFKLADTSKRIPDIRITLGESFFINGDYKKYKDEIKDLKNQIIELKKGNK